MNFDVSKRFQTQASPDDVTKFLEEAFRRSASKVSNFGDKLTVEVVNPTFGSINRKDITNVDVRQKDGDMILTANVNYAPSVMFWVLFVVLIFTTICWLVPIAFFFFQKKTVKTGIEEIFDRTATEFVSSGISRKAPSAQMAISTDDVATQIEKLSGLVEKGLLTQEEFVVQKTKILGSI